MSFHEYEWMGGHSTVQQLMFPIAERLKSEMNVAIFARDLKEKKSHKILCHV